MRSSKLITKRNTQKQMAKYGLDVTYMTLPILRLLLGFLFCFVCFYSCFFSYFILFSFKLFEFIINWQSSSNSFVENHHFNVILSCFKNFLDTCSIPLPLPQSSKYVDFFFLFIFSTWITWLCISVCFQNVYDLIFHKTHN